MLLFDAFSQYTSTIHCYGDMAADILLTNEFVESSFGQYLHYLGVYAREYNVHFLLQALLTKVGEVVHTCRVDEGHLTHADDAHGGDAAHVVHHLFEAVGNTEEVGAIDFVYLYTLRDDEMLNVVGEVAICGKVNLFCLYRYIGDL